MANGGMAIGLIAIGLPAAIADQTVTDRMPSVGLIPMAQMGTADRRGIAGRMPTADRTVMVRASAGSVSRYLRALVRVQAAAAVLALGLAPGRQHLAPDRLGLVPGRPPP
jgi:hypothetical protein